MTAPSVVDAVLLIQKVTVNSWFKALPGMMRINLPEFVVKSTAPAAALQLEPLSVYPELQLVHTFAPFELQEVPVAPMPLLQLHVLRVQLPE